MTPFSNIGQWHDPACGSHAKPLTATASGRWANGMSADRVGDPDFKTVIKAALENDAEVVCFVEKAGPSAGRE